MQYPGCIVLIVIAVLATGFAKILPPFFAEERFQAEFAVPTAADQVNYRLPNNTLPEQYTIELTTNVHIGSRSFTGIVNIDISVVETTTEITIHARQLSGFVANIVRTDLAAQSSISLLTNYIQEPEFLVLSATGVSFPKDSKWRLTISYTGTLRTDNGGFYLSTYEDENNNIRYLATTQFESTDARHGFPCYDEPAKRANFTIIIKHDPSYMALSNMPVDNEKSSSGITVFETLKSSSTYLVAFIVSDFKYSEGVLNSLPQRVYSRVGTESDQEFALISNMLIMERLSDYYGVKFPLPKIDMVAIPDFAAGAMENWGLTTYREEYLLYNPRTSSVSTQNNVADTLAHENAHQWFGDLVALKWWSYLWLKEGFATLFEYQATNATYPEWDILQMFHTGSFLSALTNDAKQSSRPMTYYIEKPNAIKGLYDYVSYAKAGSVLNMWQQALTDTVFRRGLHNYLETNQYSAADESDLFKAIQIGAGEENFAVPARIDDMMGSWSRQSNYPILKVERNYDNGSFNITQQAYFDDETITDLKTWYIPINFVTQSNPDFSNTMASHFLLNVRTITVNDVNISKDHWLILNKKSTGLYRINYDTENWNLITNQLLEKPYKIHVHNRAQLINDAYILGVSNRLSHSILLKMLTYLPKEDQYAPWYSAYYAINRINLYLRADANYNNFKSYVETLVADVYDKIGVSDVPGEHHLQPLLRNVVINTACLAGMTSCLEETTRKVAASINENKSIEPNLRSVLYCNGLKNAADTVFDGVYNLLMNSQDQALRRTLIASLGCSETANQINKFIESSIDKTNELRSQERYTLLSATYSKSALGLEQSIEFLQNNWDAYANLTTGFSDSTSASESDLVSLSNYVTNDEQAEKVYALLNTVKSKISSGTESRIQTNINKNLQWNVINRDPIMNWVDESLCLKTSSAAVVGLSVSMLLLAVLFSLLL